MAEHYSRSTTGVLKFCNRCNKMTMHKVSGKRVGLCTEIHKTAAKPVSKPVEPELTLF